MYIYIEREKEVCIEKDINRRERCVLKSIESDVIRECERCVER